MTELETLINKLILDLAHDCMHYSGNPLKKHKQRLKEELSKLFNIDDFKSESQVDS